ncbi:Fe-S cluster assembly protein SufD [Ornithinimicrobium avium]|uniref:Fe-S cluster assembly protein SufD n=1 Tax=Ornithinimicrobium avium TaxID=2283195 RepID=A0A345NJE2_9MICO|nr:Fe-S cluster assembly protein SufD [Ornithinimicrobium avium]AXH95150.1 Fe-S cluster assembly protein SufD [Ornithinimicrobium avium]
MSLLIDERAEKPVDHTDPAGLIGADRVPDESRASRHRSFDVDTVPVPTGREEEWRFTPVDRLGNVFSDAPTDVVDGVEAVDYVLEAPQGVTSGTLAPGQAPRGTVLVPEDRGAVVASKNTEQALHVQIAANAELSEPVRLKVHGQGAGRRSNAHYVLEAGAHSTGLVILDHTGAADHTGNLEVLVGDGAQLTVVSLQRWDDDGVHLAQHEALVGRDASYKHIAVSLGGGIVRMNSNVRYGGPGGEATLLGVYFADAGQHLEHRSFVDHNAPHCTSLVTYKGALQGETARTVWVGDVLIRKEAEGIDTYELNRNLVLTDGARADSVPNLEIETGEIKGAGHASSTGRFDDEQLFYLMSRGIGMEEARRLVVRGFFADIIAKIGVPEVVDRLMAAIDEELQLTISLEPAGA